MWVAVLRGSYTTLKCPETQSLARRVVLNIGGLLETFLYVGAKRVPEANRSHFAVFFALVFSSFSLSPSFVCFFLGLAL
jgi:hypothetical protein